MPVTTKLASIALFEVKVITFRGEAVCVRVKSVPAHLARTCRFGPAPALRQIAGAGARRVSGPQARSGWRLGGKLTTGSVTVIASYWREPVWSRS